MTPDLLPALSPVKFALKAGLAGVVGVGVGVAICLGLKGPAQAAGVVGAVVAIAAALGLTPALSKRNLALDRVGLIALGATLVQTLLAIGAALVATTLLGLERRPLVLGIFGGTFMAVMLQAIAAVVQINSMQGQQASPGPTPALPPNGR